MAAGDCSPYATQHTDKTGRPFEVRECGREHASALNEMYDSFSPKGESQGLPPENDGERRRWIQGLLVGGRNFVAEQNNKVVGHSALIPDLDKADAEYIIFVNQQCRNRGVGTVLTSLAVERARELGLTRIWLTVESYNFRAIKLYRRAGFMFLDHGERERTMMLDLLPG